MTVYSSHLNKFLWKSLLIKNAWFSCKSKGEVQNKDVLMSCSLLSQQLCSASWARRWRTEDFRFWFNHQWNTNHPVLFSPSCFTHVQDASTSGWKMEWENSSVYTRSACRECGSRAWFAVSFQLFRSRRKRDWRLYCCMCVFKKERGEHMDKIKLTVRERWSSVTASPEIKNTLNEQNV